MRNRRFWAIIIVVVLIIAAVAAVAFITRNNNDEAPANDETTTQIDDEEISDDTEDEFPETADDRIIDQNCRAAVTTFLQQDALESANARQARLRDVFVADSPAIMANPGNLDTSVEPPIVRVSAEITEVIRGDSDSDLQYCFVSVTLDMENSGGDLANALKFSDQIWLVTVSGDNSRRPVDLERIV